METFLTVILILLIVFFALAIALAVVEEIFNRRRNKSRESKIADGSLVIVELPDDAEAAIAAANAPTEVPQHAAASAEVAANVVEKIVYIPVAGIAGKSYAEKYVELDAETKTRLDDFLSYAAAKPQVRTAEGKDRVTVKHRTRKVFVAAIKRGVPVVSFMQTNPEFERFLKEKKIKSVKLKPIVIKLNTDENAGVAKDLVDITCSLLDRGVSTTTLGQE